MGTISRVKQWADGDTLFADDLNSEFDRIHNLVNGQLDTSNILADGVDLASIGKAGSLDETAVLADNLITAAKLAASAVTNAKINDGAVDTAKLAADAVTAAKIAADAVGNAQMADDAIDTAELVSNAVTQAIMANNAVGNAQMRDDAVDSAEIKGGAVGTSELNRSNVFSGETGTITNASDSGSKSFSDTYNGEMATVIVGGAAVAQDDSICVAAFDGYTKSGGDITGFNWKLVPAGFPTSVDIDWGVFGVKA